MTCNGLPTVDSCDFDKTVHCQFVGSKKRIQISVYQPNENFALQDCGCLSRNDIVVPPTVSVTSATVSVFLSPDSDTPIILDDTVSITSILDDSAVLVGYLLTWVFDATIAPLNAVGSYMLVFTYLLSNAEQVVSIVYVNVVKPDFVSSC